MNLHSKTQHWKLSLYSLLTATVFSLSACGAGSNSDKTSSSNETNHPAFSWEKVSVSNNYSPSGDTTNLTPTFSWKAVSDATEYNFGHESTNGIGDWKEYNVAAAEAGCTTGTTCSYKPSDKIFNVDEQKVWWVRGKANNQWQAWSNPHVFKVVDTPTPPNNGPAGSRWSTGSYGNNENKKSPELSILNSSGLTITIKGKTEKDHDYIYIYDETGKQILKVSGNLNSQLLVKDSHITVKFTSDASTTSQGATITLTDAKLCKGGTQWDSLKKACTSSLLGAVNSHNDLPAGSLSFTHWNVFRFTKFYENEFGYTAGHGKAFLTAMYQCSHIESNLNSNTSKWSNFCQTNGWKGGSNPKPLYVGTGLGWWNGNAPQSDRPNELMNWPNHNSDANQSTIVYREHSSNRTQWYEPFVELNSDIFNLNELGLDHSVPALFSDLGYHSIIHAAAHGSKFGNSMGAYPTGTFIRNTPNSSNEPTKLKVKYSVNLTGLDVSKGWYYHTKPNSAQPFRNPQGYTVVEYKGVPIVFFSAHLKSGKSADAIIARKHEIDRLVNYLKDLKVMFRHVILSGDMNTVDTESQQYLYDSMESIDLYNARSKDGKRELPTYEHQNFSANLDHVFVTQDLYNNIVTTTVFNGDGFGVNGQLKHDGRGYFQWSDHLPIKIEFMFP